MSKPISETTGAPGLAGPLGFASPEEAPALAKILDQARRSIKNQADDPQLKELIDRNHYDFMAEKLPDLVGFDEFALAEYVYALADGSNPGIRLWFNRACGQPRVSVVLFDEVGIWNVDEDGRRKSRNLLHLELTESGIRAHGGELFSGPGLDPADWRAWLARALFEPLAHK